ncbi:MAG TPA: signal peptidase I [Gaiellaceae bacterium]|nr:signal peptidase I [Gaiellaceae bacterium]
MKRLVVVAALVGSLVACGGSGSTKVVLQPSNPALTGVYLQVSGSSEAATSVASMLEQGSGGGLRRASALQGKQTCSKTIQIVTYPVTTPSLRTLAGQKVTLAFYGNGQAAPAACQELASQFPGGIPLVGGNRRIYRMPSSGMEPTLHCQKPAAGCLGSAQDVLVTRLTGANGLARFAIVVFTPPQQAFTECGLAPGTFVKRVIGLPGETVKEDAKGFIWVRGPGAKVWQKLDEPYVSARARALDTDHYNRQWNVPAGEYFTIGDNRSQSCDSRQWGPVPAASIIGPVVQIVRGGSVLKPAGIPG